MKLLRNLSFRKICPLPIEIVFALFISISFITLDRVGKNIGEEYRNNAVQSLFIQDISEFNQSNHELAKLLLENSNSNIKRLEIYDANISPLLALSFTKDTDKNSTMESMNDIRQYVYGNDEGQAIADTKNGQQAMYFKWILNQSGERRLIVIWSYLNKFDPHNFVTLITFFGIALTWGLVLIICEHRKNNILTKVDDLNYNMTNITIPLT